MKIEWKWNENGMKIKQKWNKKIAIKFPMKIKSIRNENEIKMKIALNTSEIKIIWKWNKK